MNKNEKLEYKLHTIIFTNFVFNTKSNKQQENKIETIISNTKVMSCQ